MLRLSQNLLERVAEVRNRIATAARGAGRTVDSITLLAASKAQPAAAIRVLAAQGVGDFGESYLQEALEKMATLDDVRVADPAGAGSSPASAAADPSLAISAADGRRLTWHFIGRLQANKTRPIAEHFAWVHGVDRLKIAERLSDQRPYHAPPLNICLQVNLGGEGTKGGVTPSELPALARAVAALPRLRLRGLMCLPPEEEDPARQRAWFAKLRGLMESLNSQESAQRTVLDTLSMGMSGDFEAAILEGATIIRVGTSLFGPRATGTIITT